MKAIMVMFDSLNRHMLPPYGCDWVQAPNFKRLAERTCTFERSYVGSMPCMPARRELHTGRYNFLHRSWGPLEPFDDSMPQMLKEAGIHTHLVSDHYHYWEEGGANYHTKYQTWEISRGQEGDPCIGQVKMPDTPYENPQRIGPWPRPKQDWINRSHMRDEENQPQPKTFRMGLDTIERNKDADNWFLQIETFDPHEPYFSNENYKKIYGIDPDDVMDWPPYEDRGASASDPKYYESIRKHNAALISMCDHYLGKVLDAMDKNDLWKDTLLIVNTDHGFLLGEKDCVGKCVMPFYNEVANTPLFIWDPRSGCQGERRQSLVQTIDLPATLLEYFGLELPKDMQGVPLRETIASDKPVREAGLFGVHGGRVSCTDGRYVYMRAPASDENEPCYDYTHMPAHMMTPFTVEEMRTAVMHPPFSFTKECPVMQIQAGKNWGWRRTKQTLLYDLETDPKQEHPINDPEVEARMIDHLDRLMRENDAPAEQWERLGMTTT